MASKKPYPSIRIFQHPWLERLTHVHPLTPLVLWLPVIALLIWSSFWVESLSVGQVLLLGMSGLVFWTFAEYILHRIVFHFEPRSPLQKRFQFLIHGLHHEDPVDPTRLVMPPVAAIAIASILYGIFRSVLGAAWVQPFFAFFLIGYLAYDYIHFAVHHFHPRSRIGKAIKHHHMIHHFVNHESHWGVSSPLWDYVFGTTHSSPLNSSRSPEVPHGS